MPSSQQLTSIQKKCKEVYETTTESAASISVRHGLNKSTVAAWSKKFGWIRSYTEEQMVEKPYIPKEEIDRRNNEGLVKALKKRNEHLLKDYDNLMQRHEEALAIKQFTRVSIPSYPTPKRNKDIAIPIIQYSDWHVEERVELSTTQNRNEFNPDIAKKRTKKLVENTIKLIQKERNNVTINEMLVCLGGDFINNYLHEHDTQMNYMAPLEATIYAKGLLKEALMTLAAHSNVKKIIVMCIRGNHPRLTKKMQSSNDYKMNLEAMLYYMLAQELNDPGFEWIIPESELGYIHIGGQLIRGFHGHQIGYQGGVGGLTIPVNKMLANWDKTQKADWNLMHHFHQLSMPTKRCSLNGSLVGWNSYALSRGFEYEPPLQAFQLLDINRGMTVRTPIHCE